MKHILLASIAAAALLGGCASILDRVGEDDIARLDALAEKWIAKLEAKLAEQPAEETPETPDPETPADPAPADPAPASDQVNYALLKWQYGGVNASGAKLDSPRLSGLSCNGRSVSYSWDVGMSGWGLGNGDAGAVCAAFFLKDGVWIGGKFDWVSVSRTNRELKHCEYYSNWGSSGIKLPWRGKVAFVVVSADGKRRSNVLVAEAK
ncbi:MAG: hypothetical protein PHW08_00435 [Kiritimatiellae bacterium]|nr:hypothetical protein [Kiritimatiellia bacterium]